MKIPEIDQNEVHNCAKMLVDYMTERKVPHLVGLAAMSCILAEANDKFGIEIGVSIINLEDMDCGNPQCEEHGKHKWN